MNTLAQLVPLIYHERQEEGSMLCAQHALNSLLRTPHLILIARLNLQLATDLHRGTLGLFPFRSFLSRRHESRPSYSFPPRIFLRSPRGSMTSNDPTTRLIEGEVRIWMTLVCIPPPSVVLATHVTRFLLDTGLAESPRSLGSLVGTISRPTPSAADGTSIWRLRRQTRKLAKRRDERVYEPPPVRPASHPRVRSTNGSLCSTQIAFILNLNEHWFTLRRFGAPPKGVDDVNPGQGHWFNLNSFLQKPEWVGKLYLSMVLQQSEEEGTNTQCTVLIGGRFNITV